MAYAMTHICKKNIIVLVADYHLIYNAAISFCPVSSPHLSMSCFSGSETGKVHVAEDSGIARAKLLIDTVKRREEKLRQIRNLPNAGLDKVNSLSSGGGYDIQDSKSVDSLAPTRSRETTERHVTIAANGSLLYEVELENTITYSDEKLQTNQDIKTLDLTTTVSPEALDDDHEERIQHLQEQCKRLPNMRTDLIGRSNITDFFYSPKYQFAYCKVPKSGSTFWMQLFMVRYILHIISVVFDFYALSVQKYSLDHSCRAKMPLK